VTLGAYAHQDLPFDRIVESLQPERSLSYTPLFQVAFTLQNANWQPPQSGDQAPGGSLRWSPFGVSRDTAKFDLTLNLSAPGGETPRGVSGVIEYNTDLFDRETVRRMAGHFIELLKSAVARPDSPMWSLPMLTEAELRGVADAERLQKASRVEECVHEIFDRRARENAGRVAVSFDGDEVTYGELDRRANQLANRLKRLGVGPETLVALMFEPSIEMIVAIVGVLKAGGAYLPLDPAHPVERLLYMLEDSAAPVIVGQRRLVEAVGQSGARAVYFDRDSPDRVSEHLAGESDQPPDSGVSPQNLAYVIYTSGSTGKPKGVAVTHANAVRLFASTDHWFGFGERDVWTLFHSYAFDFSVWEIWGALLYGGRLVVVPHLVTRSPEAFYALLREQSVTVLNQTPSAFRQLIKAEEGAGDGGAGLKLRFVIFGGEALEYQSLRPWFERHGDLAPRLINMYGITETTVHVTYRPAGRIDVEKNAGSLIGVPIPDLKIHLLDRRLNPAPAGVAGEICVGGGGLARGYLNRPELTAERFVPDALSAEPGARLYRSGDLARRLADGDMEYGGRGDEQVKIRGFRIELAEIESALGAHPEVREAVVIARSDEDQQKRLVAYVVAKNSSAGMVSEFRGHLENRLPSYMVPSAFVFLERLPLTVNGKVDRRALPAPEGSRPELSEGYAPPVTETEIILASIWGEALGVDRVGIDDNYFALGGDSIRSIQVRSLAAQRGIELSLQRLFQHQTIRQLAQNARRTEGPARGAKIEPFGLISEQDRAKLPGRIEDAYPLAMLQAGMLFHTEYSRAAGAYHNVSSFHVRAPFDAASLTESVRRLVNRHGILRTSFHLGEYGEPLQIVHQEVEPPLTIDDLRDLDPGRQEQALNQWLQEERANHFDWGLAPLLRFRVHLRSDESFQFTLTEHHAILDGWSVASMLTELFRTYLSLASGADLAPEPPPETTFRDFVALEREARESEEFREYWAEKLAGSSPTLLPRVFADAKPGAPAQVRVIDVPVSRETSQGLKRLAQQAGVPVKSVLLGAHLKVMSALGGGLDVMTGVVTNGRPEQDDGERALGLFLNTVPFRVKLKGGTWGDLAREAFDAEIEMTPYRRYPMAELLKARGGARLFETSFNFTHFHVYDSLQGVEGAEMLSAESSATTDFTLGANFSLNLANTQVQLSLHCNATEIGDRMVDVIAGHYQRALVAMAAEPHGRYDARGLLSEGDYRRAVVDWNDTARPYAAGECVHSLVEAQSRNNPEAIAVVCGQWRLTYAELESKAENLAAYLRGLGKGPEDRIAICMSRSPEMIIGLLGILKSGAAYVPLDPNYPRERFEFIVHDAGCSLILSEERFAPSLINDEVPVVIYDEGLIGEAGIYERLPGGRPSGENLAYIIHTSGSAGMPKGVMIEHRALVNHALAIGEAYGIGGDHRVLQFIGLNFDAAAEEIFPFLAAGATIVLHPDPTALSPAELLGQCEKHEITTLHLPAAYWGQLEESLVAAGRRAPQSLKAVIVGGFSPPYRRVDAWNDLLSAPSDFFNAYGPTEATITCLAQKASPDAARPADTNKMPIGRPVANVRAYVLDAFLHPAPVGVAGELYIAGAGLGRGYINCPELTAERYLPDPFVADPCAAEAGQRIYKTGDVCRYLPDGSIEFLGRVDSQVKIRGFRVELGEIEHRLKEHPAVQDALVVVAADPAGEARLAAYVVAGPDLTAGELRGHLKQKLPDYMAPRAFVMLEAMPLNENGKVDKSALPPPAASALASGASASGEPFVAPRTPAEQAIAEIWSQLLAVEPVGVHSDFFDLGGHSITATRLVTQLRKAFQVDVPLRAVFERPTIAALSELIEAMLIDEIEGQASN
jgi:amino acid adenylation domain-containing protein